METIIAILWFICLAFEFEMLFFTPMLDEALALLYRKDPEHPTLRKLEADIAQSVLDADENTVNSLRYYTRILNAHVKTQRNDMIYIALLFIINVLHWFTDLSIWMIVSIIVIYSFSLIKTNLIVKYYNFEPVLPKKVKIVLLTNHILSTIIILLNIIYLLWKM